MTPVNTRYGDLIEARYLLGLRGSLGLEETWVDAADPAQANLGRYINHGRPASPRKVRQRFPDLRLLGRTAHPRADAASAVLGGCCTPPPHPPLTRTPTSLVLSKIPLTAHLLEGTTSLAPRATGTDRGGKHTPG